MGRRNYLVEGVSGTGKTSVCRELRRRGYDAVNGDTDLAYQGDPATGEPVAGTAHEHHLWDVAKVRELAADQRAGATFFCGGSRNFPDFLAVFDEVFVLEIDADTLRRRLDARPKDEWGGRPEQRALIERLHSIGEDTPPGTSIDATAPLAQVVDEILRLSGHAPVTP
ncbi:MAG: nucleoside kinase [Actinobacteria bacterium]|nr:nucleoside kinase [Actinomycetota bacterium]